MSATPTAHHTRPAARFARPWAGATVMVRHYPDGAVAATSRGRVGCGWSEDEALRALALAVPGRPAATPNRTELVACR